MASTSQKEKLRVLKAVRKEVEKMQVKKAEARERAQTEQLLESSLEEK